MSTRAERPNAPPAAEPPRIPEQSARTTGPHTSFFIKDTSRPQLRFSMGDPAPPRSEPVRNVFLSVWGVELPPPVFPHRGCSLIRRGGTWHATKGTARLRCSPIRPGGTAPVDMETLRVRLFSHPPGRDGVCRHGDAPSAALSPTRPGGTVPVDMETPRVRLYLPSA